LAALAAVGYRWFEGGRKEGQDVQRAAAVATGRVGLVVMMLVTLPVARTSVWLWVTGKDPSLLPFHRAFLSGMFLVRLPSLPPPLPPFI